MNMRPQSIRRSSGSRWTEVLLLSAACALSLLITLAMFLGLDLVPTARAAESPAPNQGVKIELNKLEAGNNACRAYLLLENQSASSFESLKLDLVLFDGDGIVAKRLAVEGAPLPKDKTSLKVFDIAGLPCDGIGRILLNKLTACSDAEGTRSDCLALVSTSARGSVPFIK